jgi:hypothetical protein
MPLAWESSLDDIIEMDELFSSIMRNTQSFSKVFANKQIHFDKFEQINVDVQNLNVKGQTFSWANALSLLIDDGDPTRKKRSMLLDNKFKSILIVINRQKSVMHILLFGEKRELHKDNDDY